MRGSYHAFHRVRLTRSPCLTKEFGKFLQAAVSLGVFKNQIPKIKMIARDFTGGAVVKNSPVNAGDMGSSPGPGGSDTPRSN